MREARENPNELNHSEYRSVLLVHSLEVRSLNWRFSDRQPGTASFFPFLSGSLKIVRKYSAPRSSNLLSKGMYFLTPCLKGS
jgi:hypothetical protein